VTTEQLQKKITNSKAQILGKSTNTSTTSCFGFPYISGHNLHPRTHSFALPSKDPRNFVSRTLYGALLKYD